MRKIDIDYLKKNDLIIFETIAGSHAYGTATETSDTDIRGIFMLSLDDLMGLDYVSQVSDETNDTTYYEVGRFIELLYTNNPNIIELLNSPEDCVTKKDPIFDIILNERDKFLSKICKNTFGGYATQQIKKARGLNKKIVKQFEKERKGVLEFCYVPWEQGSIPVKEYLEHFGMQQKYCGLVSIPHMKNTYGVYYNKAQELNELHGKSIPVEKFYRGIVTDEKTSSDVCLSDIPKGQKSAFTMHFNMEGFSVYCKEYKEYWEWVEKRNPHRFADNMLHGKGYDGKNLSHCFRLLEMAKEIAEGKGIIVRRPNRDLLLAIRKGAYDYDELLARINNLENEMDLAYEKTFLPDSIDKEFAEKLIVRIRKIFYTKRGMMERYIE